MAPFVGERSALLELVDFEQLWPTPPQPRAGARRASSRRGPASSRKRGALDSRADPLARYGEPTNWSDDLAFRLVDNRASVAALDTTRGEVALHVLDQATPRSPDPPQRQHQRRPQRVGNRSRHRRWNDSGHWRRERRCAQLLPARRGHGRSRAARPHAASRTLSAELFAKEAEDPAPSVHRLLGAVHRSVVVDEPVPRSLVAVELVVLAKVSELGLMAVDLLG